MNLGSKGKKRVVLPSRPEPPTVEQILEDISNTASDDPLFSLLDKLDQASGPSSGDSEVELKFKQCRRFMELNQSLTEAQLRLNQQREELRRTGASLQRDIQEVTAGPLRQTRTDSI